MGDEGLRKQVLPEIPTQDERSAGISGTFGRVRHKVSGFPGGLTLLGRPVVSKLEVVGYLSALYCAQDTDPLCAQQIRAVPTEYLRFLVGCSGH